MSLCYSTDKNTNATIQQGRECSNRRDRRSDRRKMDAELKAQSTSGRNLERYKRASGRAL